MAYVQVTITDTLGFWDDNLGDHAFDPQRAKTFSCWYRVPEDWLERDLVLRPERWAAIFAYLYGPTWQLGNADGSKYIVLKADGHVLTPAEAAVRLWRDVGGSWFRVGQDGVIGPADGDDF